MKKRKTLAVLSAAVLSVSCVPINAVCTSASLITDVKDKLENDVFDYFSAVEEAGGCSSAKVVMSSPDSTLEFRQITEDELSPGSGKLTYYTGTVEIAGETYYIVREKPINSYTNKLDELGAYYNNYVFYHLCGNEDEILGKTTFQMYELIQAAKYFGLETGTVSSIDLDDKVYDCSCDITALKKDGEDIPWKVYSELSKRRVGCIILDSNDFFSNELSLGMGSEMTAGTDGSFSLTSDGRPLFSNKFLDSYMEKNLLRTSSWYGLDAENNISIDYHVDDSMDGKYGIVYKFWIDSNEPKKRISLKIAEKVSGMDIEEFFASYEESLGIGNHLSFRSYEPVNTYTAGGHEYDLYNVQYHFSGEFSFYDETCYLAVRKDTAEEEHFDGSISAYDHLKQTVELASGVEVTSVELDFHNCGATGTVDITKNDIKFGENKAPRTVAGDFNNDLRIASFDVVWARNAILSQLAGEDVKTDKSMDLNKDGSFNVADVVMLQSFVLGKIKFFS